MSSELKNGRKFVKQKKNNYFSDRHTQITHKKLRKKLKKSATGIRFALYNSKKKLQLYYSAIEQ